MMKRIFIIDEHISSKQNGVGTYMRCLLKCLEGLDADVNFISFNAEEKHFSIYNGRPHRLFCFPLYNGGNMLGAGDLCWSILRMHVRDEANNIFFVNHSPCRDFLKSLRKQFRRSRIIFTIHDQGWTASLLGDKEHLRKIVSRKYPCKEKYKSERYCKRYFTEEQQMYRIVNDVVCLSATTRDLLCDTYKVPREKIHVIPNGISMDDGQHACISRKRLRQDLGIGANERVLLFVGRTVKAKGIAALLEAFEHLRSEEGDLRLVIAGEIFTYNEFAKLTPQGISHITCTGLIPADRLQAWYRAADVGVLPSYTEQCSYAGMEMMANDLLIVTTDGNGLTDMFHADDNALVAQIDPSFTKSLEDTLRRAINLSQEERRAICQRAKDCVQTRYSLSSMKEGYRQLLSNGSNTSTITNCFTI